MRGPPTFRVAFIGCSFTAHRHPYILHGMAPRSRVADIPSWRHSAHLLRLFLTEMICACEQCCYVCAISCNATPKMPRGTAAVPQAPRHVTTRLLLPNSFLLLSMQNLSHPSSATPQWSTLEERLCRSRRRTTPRQDPQVQTICLGRDIDPLAELGLGRC
jgi:hypothetical protein